VCQPFKNFSDYFIGPQPNNFMVHPIYKFDALIATLDLVPIISHYFSIFRPPILGPEKRVCDGHPPKSSDEMRMMLEMMHHNSTEDIKKRHDEKSEEMKMKHHQEEDSIIGRWTVYMFISMFVSMTLTAIVTYVIARCCCFADD
jgi:hypothetical protein